MFRNFFRGRYGIDTLSFVYIFAAVILARFRYLWIISLGILMYVVYRALSREVSKRYQEQMKFNQGMAKFVQFFTRKSGRFGSRPYYNPYGASSAGSWNKPKKDKNHVLFRCPKCKNTLRLPKNKGKLRVTCPVCKDEFLKKT